jgi:hypothetical protein
MNIASNKNFKSILSTNIGRLAELVNFAKLRVCKKRSGGSTTPSSAICEKGKLKASLLL